MCHLSRLSVVNQSRFNRMPKEYKAKLEDALENEGYIASTRAAVTPVFERIYAAWQEREAAVAAARLSADPVAPRSVANLTTV